MNLTKYLCKMIAQEAQALGNLAYENCENDKVSNRNFQPIMGVYARLSGFMRDYEELSRTGDISRLSK